MYLAGDVGDMAAERDAIAPCTEPRTRESLAHDLRELGMTAGMTVLVHVSLSSPGWVWGGPIAAVQALMDVVTPVGTIVMPAMKVSNTDLAAWVDPPVPKEWIPIIGADTPAYDPAITPTRGIGVVAEVFRSFLGVIRSAHPNTSFTAWGRNCALGRRQPRTGVLPGRAFGAGAPVRPRFLGGAARGRV